MKLEGANVLVTGAGGFVGAHVVRALLERDARVHATLLAEPPPSASLASWHRADLTDPQALRVAVAASAPDFVVHLAGQSSAGLSFELPVETFRVNAVGTWNLLEAVKAAAPSARVLAVGSATSMARNRRAPTSARMRNSVPSVRTRCPRPRPTCSPRWPHETVWDVVRTRSFAARGCRPGTSLRPAVVGAPDRGDRARRDGARDPRRQSDRDARPHRRS
jgi:nucleoside-diphosphate-sugar epimerase